MRPRFRQSSIAEERRGARRSTTAILIALACFVLPASAQNFTPKPPDVRYLATPQNVVEAMLEFAGVTAADVVYDLGCGDGRIPITAAAKYGARGVGVELDMFHLRDAFDNRAKAGVVDRVALLHQDLFDTDISGATVVTLFLLPRINQQLIPKLKRELRPGARVVSHLFDMGTGWPPDAVRDVDGLQILLWIIR
jgi:SAM-dependent methyltransferase